MKKFLSILLAFVMVLSLVTVAFAEEPAENTNSKTFETVTDDPETEEIVENATSFDVTATANVIPEGSYANITYSVKVEWEVDAAEIDVNNGEVYKWDHETLTYVKDDTASASKVGASDSVGVKITLTNSSNAAVNYTVSYVDNNTDVFTTSEAAKIGSELTGTIATADTIEGVATASKVDSFDYDINYSAQGEKTGKAQTVVYEGTVTVTEITNATGLKDADDITLGTYTVTLGAVAVAPTFSTVQEILDTVPGGFPTDRTAAWKDSSKNQSSYITDNGDVKIAGWFLTLNTPVTKNDDGAYVVEKESDGPEGTNHTTFTFSMTDNALTSIRIVQTGEPSYDYTLAPVN